MNLRDIKKDIEYILSAFVEDCSIFVTVNPKASEDKVAALIDEAVALYNDLRNKVGAKKIEGSKKLYYMDLRKELLEKTDALYEKLSAAVKTAGEEAPKAEKKPAAAKKPAAKKAPAKKAAEAPAEEAPKAEKKPAAKKPAAEKKPAAAKKPAA